MLYGIRNWPSLHPQKSYLTMLGHQHVHLLTEKLDAQYAKSLRVSTISYHIFGLNDVIQNGRRNLTISHGTSSVRIKSQLQRGILSVISHANKI